MAQLASSFAAGLIFGMGLLISQLANPAKVLAFLDVFGTWDPRCLIPRCGDTISHHAARDALWARFCTEAPARRRRSVARYSYVKRA
jgi:uncharacterized membrane protein YedE/YeeE